MLEARSYYENESAPIESDEAVEITEEMCLEYASRLIRNAQTAKTIAENAYDLLDVLYWSDEAEAVMTSEKAAKRITLSLCHAFKKGVRYAMEEASKAMGGIL